MVTSIGNGFTVTNNQSNANLKNDTSTLPQNVTNNVLGNVSLSSCKSNNLNDVDGDMIPNDIELNGIDVNHDGIIDLDLKKAGASPYHKDLYVEVDYMTNHKPADSAMSKVKDVFSKAPLCNPDGINGINLHIDISDEIPEKASIDLLNSSARTLDEYTNFKDLYNIKSTKFGDTEERFDQNVNNTLNAKRLLYHYGLFVHSVNNQKGLLGIAKNIPAWDFVVSLGGGNSRNEMGHIVGTESQQAATFMHEFGHTIGLYHGGGDPDINDKPNYLSDMNYVFTNAVVPNSDLEFSDCSLDSLNESALLEPTGINGSSNKCIDQINKPSAYYSGCVQFFGSDGQLHWKGLPHFIRVGQPIDWNLSKKIDLDPQKENINCDGSSTQTFTNNMKGYDDWHNIVFLPVANNISNLAPSSNLNTFERFNLSNGSNSSGMNNTDQKKDDLVLQTLKNEPNQENITNVALGTIAGINNYIEKNINSSSFTIPQNAEGFLMLPSNVLKDVKPSILGKEFYKQILGDPTSNQSTPQTFARLGLASQDNTVTNDIRQGNIDSAINKLDILLSTSDSSFGGTASNDFINNTSDQQNLVQQITYLQNQLKKQSCTYNKC
ncbi:MAG TPA: hypothetical protein VN703_00065 [Candidatus Sulfopaludibacter sp.]|nr:hypothetical protein [Candidatus Sulfopaludibacter sp.]